MTTPTQQDAASMFYPFNPCGYLTYTRRAQSGRGEDDPARRRSSARRRQSELDGSAVMMLGCAALPHVVQLPLHLVVGFDSRRLHSSVARRLRAR